MRRTENTKDRKSIATRGNLDRDQCGEQQRADKIEPYMLCVYNQSLACIYRSNQSAQF